MRIPVAATTAQRTRRIQTAEHPTQCGGPDYSGPSGRSRRPTHEAEQPGRQERLSAPKARPALDAVTRLDDLGRIRIVRRSDLRLVFDRADARLLLRLRVRRGRLLRER